MSLPIYTQWRQTDAPWLPRIPSHWDLKPLKAACEILPSNVDKKSYDGEASVRLCNYTDVYYNDAITTDLELMAATASQDQIIKFGLRGGDTIITKDSETADDIGRSAYVATDLPGVVCGYHLAILRPRASTDGAFLKWMFDTHFVRAQLEVGANGLTRVGLSQATLGSVVALVPPREEQRTIAQFLWRETAKIDALISEQERLIELLQEKRQAVISQAVTKGLNPNAAMRASGIEWLGQVPAHWKVRELRHLVAPGTTITYGIVQAGPDIEGGIPYIRTSDMAGDALPSTGYMRTTSEIDRAYQRSKVRANDLVVAIRASLGKGLLVPPFLDGANLTQGTARVAPGPDLLPAFLAHAFNSTYCQASIRVAAKGTTFLEITLDELRRVALAVPPLEEQASLVAWVDERVRVFDELQKEAERAVGLLKERRSALISAAVTGQIDVRCLAPSSEGAAA